MHSSRKGTKGPIRSRSRRGMLAGFFCLALAVVWGGAWLSRGLALPLGTVPPIVELSMAPGILGSLSALLNAPESGSIIDDLIRTGSLFHIATEIPSGEASPLVHTFFYCGKKKTGNRFMAVSFRSEQVNEGFKISPPVYSYETVAFGDWLHPLAAGAEELEVLKAIAQDPMTLSFLGAAFKNLRVDYLCIEKSSMSSGRFDITFIYDNQADAHHIEKKAEAQQTPDGGYRILYD